MKKTMNVTTVATVWADRPWDMAAAYAVVDTTNFEEALSRNGGRYSFETIYIWNPNRAGYERFEFNSSDFPTCSVCGAMNGSCCEEEDRWVYSPAEMKDLLDWHIERASQKYSVFEEYDSSRAWGYPGLGGMISHGRNFERIA